MKRRSLLFLIPALALLAPGCYYDNEEELYPNSFCDTANVTWSGTIQPLMQASCAIPGCHVPGGQSPDLSTYTAVKAKADDGGLRGVIIDGTPFFMPNPPVGLPACDRLKVDAWLRAGAPQN